MYAFENSNIDVGWLFVGNFDLEQEKVLFKDRPNAKQLYQNLRIVNKVC
jgi:hypothetical protein